MSKNSIKITMEGNEKNDENVNVKITISEDAKDRIPRPGDSIYVIEPYPVDDDNDPDEPKEKVIMGYSYAGVMAKSVVLTDELDEVIVNGDYRIPLYKNAGEFNRKNMTFSKEEEAMEKYRTLMNASIKEAKRRRDRAVKVHDYLEEAMERMHH